MKTKKVYPFIVARIFEGKNEALEDHVITFDAREVAYYHYHEKDENVVTVGFKSGKEIPMYLELDAECYPDDNLRTAIDMVQYSHFWHDNKE
jgi:hypothetical protein|nr:MAG TPA: hypothetical protein [Caudoviricetes sp.]